MATHAPHVQFASNVSTHALLSTPAIEPPRNETPTADTPTSGSAFTPFSLTLSFSAAVTKAVRAYERERAQTRERRARSGRRDRHEREGHGHARRRGAFAELFWLRFGAGYVSDESEEGDQEGEGEGEDEDELDEKRTEDDGSVDDDHLFSTPPSTPPLQAASLDAPLMHLLAASLLRRAEELTARDEFEVIPSVRNVIVLEEQALAELEPDDPWEYINDNAELEDDVTVPSYADVVVRSDLD